MSRPLALALAVVAALAGTARPAAAQDDWGVQRDPFDKKVIAGFKRLLARNPGDKDALARLTRLYRKHRSVALLVTEYEKQVAADPRDFAALVVLGHLALADGKREPALAFYERAAVLKPDDGDLSLVLGGLYRQVGKPKEAGVALGRALRVATARPQKKAILRTLADLAIDAGDLPTARKHFDAYLALDPGDIDARLALADALGRAKQFDEAIGILRAAEAKLAADPARRVEVVARIGATLEAAGKDDQAIAEFDRAIGMVKRGYYLRKELTERIIETHRRRQSLPSLIARYEKAWTAAGRDHFEWDVLARLYEETGQQDKAIEAFRKAVAKAPHELDTQRRLITLYENAGRAAEALKQYEVVMRVAPGEPRFQIELAERLWKRGDEKKALALLKQLDARFGGDAGVEAALADLYSRWGKDDLALAAHQRLTQIEPNEVSHLVNLGEQYFQKNDKKKALAIWKKIADDKRPESQAKLGEVYAEHDMLAESLELYGRAIKAKPKDPELYKGRAVVFERKKDFDHAIADWDRVLELVPPSKATRAPRREARRQIVNLLKRAGGLKLRERTSIWERAFGKRPPDVEAGHFLVEADVRSGNTRRARIVLEKLLALEPDDLDTMDALVKVYEAERAHDKAIALLESMVAKAPGRERELYNRIAEIKTLLHQDDEAIRYAQKALEKSPNDPMAHQQLAERYQEMQQYELAIKAYERAIAIDARGFRAYFALARLYRNKHALGDAARLYREVLKRASDDEVLVKAGREAIALEELTGTLGELEAMLAPLAFTYAHKPVYRRLLVELYERHVPALVAVRRRGGSGQVAADRALDALGAHGLKPLLEALGDDSDPVQQRIAVGVLGHLGNRGAAAPLVRLATEPVPDAAKRRIGTLIPTLDWDVRVEALVAAGRLGDPRTMPDLVALTGHAEVAMREAAVFALGMTADPRATAPLIAATSDRRDTVQTLACLGLARTGEARATAAARGALADEQRSDETRAACAFALGVLGDRAAVPALAQALAAGNDETQRLAAWALGRLGDPRAMPALLGAYFAKRDHVRDAVAWALPRLGGNRTVGGPPTPLDYPMRNGKFDQRAAIAALAHPLEPPALSPALIVGHDVELVAGVRGALARHRDLILRVLADLDARPAGLALGPLTAGLDRGEAGQRRGVDAALEKIGAALGGDLATLVEHRDPLVRQRALSVLAKIGGPRARAALTRGLADPELSVREAAMRSAAQLVERQGDEGLVAAVAHHLEAAGWQERAAAAAALGRIGNGRAGTSRSALTALGRALAGDEKAFVRVAAARALGQLRARGALEALARAASAQHEAVSDVRLAAVEALAALGDRAGRAALESVAKSDPDPAVRAAAALRKK